MFEFVIIYFTITAVVALVTGVALAIKAGLVYLPVTIKKVAQRVRKEEK